MWPYRAGSREPQTDAERGGDDERAPVGPTAAQVPGNAALAGLLAQADAGPPTAAVVDLLASAAGNGEIARLLHGPTGTEASESGAADLGPDAAALLADIDAARDELVSASPEPQSTVKTKGKTTYDRARALLNEDTAVKAEVSYLRSAISAIRQGKAVDWNANAGRQRIDNIGRLLHLDSARTGQWQAAWTALVAKLKPGGGGADVTGFLAPMHGELDEQRKPYQRAQTHDWLRYLSPAVADLIYAVSDDQIPPDQLFAYAYQEGLLRHVRDQLALPDKKVPTEAQLASFNTAQPIDGYVYLGMDDFGSKGVIVQPSIRALLPPGFDISKLNPAPHLNDAVPPRLVYSALFPDLKTALQGIVAMLKQRRNHFLADATKNGYVPPSSRELIYWTFVYYNSGESEGSQTLRRHAGKRPLAYWIEHGLYPNAQALLQSHELALKLKLFER